MGPQCSQKRLLIEIPKICSSQLEPSWPKNEVNLELKNSSSFSVWRHAHLGLSCQQKLHNKIMLLCSLEFPHWRATGAGITRRLFCIFFIFCKRKVRISSQAKGDLQIRQHKCFYIFKIFAQSTVKKLWLKLKTCLNSWKSLYQHTVTSVKFRLPSQGSPSNLLGVYQNHTLCS